MATCALFASAQVLSLSHARGNCPARPSPQRNGFTVPVGRYMRARKMSCSAIFGAPGGGQGNDPFAAVRAGTPAQVKPAGFLAAGQDRAKLMTEADADTLLRRFDRDFMMAQRAGATTATTTDCTEPAMRAAVIALAARSSGVMLGICAENSKAGVEVLKRWTAGLGLPKGLLHGMDKDGVPIELPGSVFIKYNSVSGDANISEYGGNYRGVLFTPQLPDGNFRQFGYLPLSLL